MSRPTAILPTRPSSRYGNAEGERSDLFVAEMSLDGLGEFHNKFRGSPGSFDKAMETYDALAAAAGSDPRLRIHSISTATDVNMDEIRRLTTYLFDRCPKMDHHNLALIRGDRKNPSLQGPSLQQYQLLYEYVRRLWASREEGRYGSMVEPMLQWAKSRTAATAETGGSMPGRPTQCRGVLERRRERL